MLRHRFDFSRWVQGRGFRPELWRVARHHGLSGWVRNAEQRVQLEAQGTEANLRRFRDELVARFGDAIHVDVTAIPAVPEETSFEILSSEVGSPRLGDLPADVATCRACLDELTDPLNRRYRYPFITCAACGPRYSILSRMPYDRIRTTMNEFPLCGKCQTEYRSEDDRRFHAETISCPDCGPTLTFRGGAGATLAEGDGAMALAVSALREGCIVAVKGIGGFHLVVDAKNSEAVAQLRERKRRPEKPFALLVGDLEVAHRYAEISPAEAALLESTAAPIVLLKKRSGADVVDGVAPGLGGWGVFLAANPLQTLLCEAMGRPLVATSGNRSNEPLCFENEEARQRLEGIADFFLEHDRRIERPIDDSVARVIEGQPMLLRRARGYPMRLGEWPGSNSAIATGAYLKNTVAWSENGTLYLMPHLGDLDSTEARSRFQRRIGELRDQGLWVADAHPNYPCRDLAEQVISPGARWLAVPHHEAHLLSGMVDHRLTPPFLGVAWDGMGLGSDGKLWGGEFFEVTPGGRRRVASFLPFRLLGGDRAAREGRRIAAALVWQSGGELPPSRFGLLEEEVSGLRRLFQTGLASPECSSVGRLFDAVAAYTGLCPVSSYEGHAAAVVETAAQSGSTSLDPYPVHCASGIWDWRQMFLEIARGAESPSEVSYRFHLTLAKIIVETARQFGHRKVLLTGGCFQNELLSRLAISRLREEGFTPYWHREIPPNDGGIAVGQMMAAWEDKCV